MRSGELAASTAEERPHVIGSGLDRREDAAYVLFELWRAGGTIDGLDLADVARDGLAELGLLEGPEGLIRQRG